MGIITETMYTFFQDSKIEGAYMLLFALSIVILYVTDREKNRFHVLYPIILMFGVVCNPVTVWILSLIFPVVGDYEPIVSMIPLIIYIPFGITELIYSLKSRSTKRLVAVLLFAYVGICGNFFGLYSGNTVTDARHYSGETREIVEFVRDNTQEMALADEGVLSFITAYGDGVPLLYGHDIMLIRSDLGVMDRYDEELIALHTMMWEPEKYIEDIAKVANKRGCDIIVVKCFDGIKDAVGPYREVLTTDDYVVYRRIG